MIKLFRLTFNINKKLNKMESNIFSSTKLYEYEHKKPLVIYKTIYLQPWEEEIFNIIKKVLEKNNKKTVCRVAGGWVRDKVKIY
jgi:hypothetical protein